MNKIRLLGWVVALFVMVSPHGYSDALEKVKKSKVLKVGIEPGFLPFEMQTKKGEWVGFDINMMNAFAADLGVKAKFISTKWEGIVPGLMAKKYDVIVSGMTITKERAKAVAFSDPYYKAGLKVLLSKKSSNKIKSIKDLNSKNVSIAVKLGTTGDLYTKDNMKKATIRKLDNEADAAQSVLFGKVDAFIYDKPYLELYMGSKGKNLVLLPGLLSEEHFGLAARKKDKALLAAFNSFLKKWKKAGGYKKSYDEIFVKMSWKNKFPELFKL